MNNIPNEFKALKNKCTKTYDIIMETIPNKHEMSEGNNSLLQERLICITGYTLGKRHINVIFVVNGVVYHQNLTIMTS